MAKSAWSTKKPAKPGWYWMTYPDTKPSLVKITKYGKRLYCLEVSIDYHHSKLLWQPVQPPKL